MPFCNPGRFIIVHEFVSPKNRDKTFYRLTLSWSRNCTFYSQKNIFGLQMVKLILTSQFVYFALRLSIQHSIHVSGTNVDDHTYCTSSPNSLRQLQRNVQGFNVPKIQHPTNLFFSGFSLYVQYVLASTEAQTNQR